MKRSSYRDLDYDFAQMIFTLRTSVGLTQTGLADFLGISRRAVAGWESGGSYPKVEHLKNFIALAVQQGVFPQGREAEAIRMLWKVARQKVLLDEGWLTVLLTSSPADKQSPAPASAPSNAENPLPYASQPAGVSMLSPATSLVGRGAELAEIGRLLSDPTCHLLTLLGPGGIGKTRLSLEVGASFADRFADGVTFVPLASVAAPSQIISAVGDTFNLSFAGHVDPTAYLLDYLRERHLLLVLDNFEHLVEGADLVHQILQHAPHVTVLVTSRERLNLRVEWLFEVEGLSYPLPDQRGVVAPKTLAELGEYSAVQLFLQRAAQVHPLFSVTEASLALIVSICQHVAGMPLAIELAAAGVRTLQIAEIEQQIRSNLDSLSTIFHDVPARHRSMRAVIDHSWDLLTEPERALFSRLAVFRGGWSASAAEHVSSAALPALVMLVDKSLVHLVGEQSPSLPGLPAKSSEPRFNLLGPIREYALEKLAVRGEVETLQRAHALYYLAFSEEMTAQWDSPSAEIAIRQLKIELDNLRAVLRWARDGGNHRIGLQLAGALWRFWRSYGDLAEGRLWLNEFLALDDASDSTVLSARLRALHGAAWLASDQHDFARAARLFEQSMTVRRALGDTEGDTNLLVNAARQARAAGQYKRATTLLEDSVLRHRAMGNRESMGRSGIGQSLYELGLVLREQGVFDRAAALIEESVALHQEIGDPEGMTICLMGLGDIARDQGAVAQIRHYCEPSLALFRELGMQWAIGFGLNNLALAAYTEGDLPRALSLIQESVSLFRAQQADASLAEVLVTLGLVLQAQGDLMAGQAALTEALQLARVVGPYGVVAASLEALAGVIVQRGQAAFAARLLATAAAMRNQMGVPVRPIDQPALARTLAEVRSHLDSTAFNAVWSEMGALTLDQIFSPLTFDTILQPVSSLPSSHAQSSPPLAPVPQVPAPYLDWGDALTVPSFYGRAWEMNLLTEWVVRQHCRVVSVLGLGGIGKSALTVTLMHRVAQQFEVVVWRSLRDLPTCDVLLDDLLGVFLPQLVGELPASQEQRLSLLLEHMRRTRALVVLDNLESVLEEDGTGRVRPGYEGFGRFLRNSAETEHRSCVLLTSREKPADLLSQEGSRSPVRALRLVQLDADACEALLTEKEVKGSKAERGRLIESYAGNPLALKIVAQTVADLFDGEISAFFEQGEVIFGGVRELLRHQFDRLSQVEQSVLLWLAILREPATFAEVLTALVAPVRRSQLLEAFDRLHRRSLIERGQKQGSFTLQSVVLEYLTAHLIEQASEEIQSGKLVYLVEHGLELAYANDYVWQSQQRLLVTPLLAHLLQGYSNLEAHLRTLLDSIRALPEESQGYAPANLVALLRMQRGDLRGVDLSRLLLRGVALQGVEIQDATLSGAQIRDSSFSESFDALIAVAVNASGECWAASSSRGEIWLWTESGQTLDRVWQAHADMIWGLAFSPDGSLLASGSWDGAVRLWDVASGALLWSGSHTSYINSIAFSPDGSTVSSSGTDAAVRLWDVQTGQSLRVLSHPASITSALWSPDGRLLAAGDLEGNLHLWDMSQPEPVLYETLAAHANWIDGMEFSPDSAALASASWDGTVRVWAMPDSRLLWTLVGHSDQVSRVAWSPDGRTLASASRDNMIRLWDVEKGTYRAVLKGHTASAKGLAFTPDSRNLLTGSVDGTLRLWDTIDGQCIRVVQGYIASLYDIDWSPDGTQLVSGGTDALVAIYSVDGETPPRLLTGHNGVVIGVGWSPDGRTLASSEWDNTIHLWDQRSGESVQVLQYDGDANSYFYGVAWSPNGGRLASGTNWHGAHIFELTERPPLETRSLPTWIRPVAWSPDGARLAGGGDDGCVYIWDAQNGALLHWLERHHSMVTSVAWSPDGAHLASSGSGTEGGELFIWDTLRGELLNSLVDRSGIVSALAWGATAESVVSGNGAGALRWWGIGKSEPLRVVEAHHGTVQALRRSPDGTKLASAGDDGAIMLWDLPTGRYLKTLRRDRPYERLDISGIKGLTDAQKAALRALGAVEYDRPR